MYTTQALHDINDIYPPFSENKETASIGQHLLLEVVREMGIEKALTQTAILRLGFANQIYKSDLMQPRGQC